MSAKVRPYVYYDVAISICSTCHRKVEGKIVFQDDAVWMLKRCAEHGAERVLVADDIDYYKKSREVYIKAPEQPHRYNTPVRYGCPYDCGICPDHEQHSCLSLLEITDHCNLTCPTCYAASGPHRPGHRSLAEIERMLDTIVANEKEPDVVQVSGGEPTTHPEFFAVLDAAKRRPIRHLMVNTNGIRIAQDAAFAKRLASYAPRFEVYLQFDSFRAEALFDLRGADLRRTREQALERLNELNLSTTLVVTVKRGVNDDELGSIVDFALKQRCVRGVTFQPVQDAGRNEGFDGAHHRLTLTEVRRRILEQTSVFAPSDIIPVPCHPDALAMGYALKIDGTVKPLTGLIGPDVLLESKRNTIVFEGDPEVRNKVFKLFSTNHSPESGARSLRDLLCCLPRVLLPKSLGYDNVFRVLIMKFMDAHDFDVRSVKKSCVHIATPSGHMVPFDTYNLFYRDDLVRTRLERLRREIEPQPAHEGCPT